MCEKGENAQVNASEAPELISELGVDTLPTFAFFAGAHGLVSRFSATLNQQSLARLRLQLRTHSTPRASLEFGQARPSRRLAGPPHFRAAALALTSTGAVID